jgi:hypothetical protein
MSKLVNMKVDPKTREKDLAVTAAPVEGPTYPYGLEINLDEEAIDKLGIALPEVGKDLALLARVSVTRVSSSENTYGGKTEKRRNLSLQITDMCLEPDEGEGKSAAEALYGG